MAVRFTPVLPEGCSRNRPEGYDDYDWCLCAQSAPNPCELIHSEEGREILRQHAETTCPWCQGTGISRSDANLYAPCVEWANANAQVLCTLLGFEHESGTLSVGRMRLHIERARTKLAHGHGKVLERAPVREMMALDDAILPKFFSPGLDAGDMARRLDALEQLLDQADSLGCKEITWS